MLLCHIWNNNTQSGRKYNKNKENYGLKTVLAIKIHEDQSSDINL